MYYISFTSCFYKFLFHSIYSFFFFFNDTATTEIYTLSLHDALPISVTVTRNEILTALNKPDDFFLAIVEVDGDETRSEEHTSELQSRLHLVCRLLLEKKKSDMPTPQREVAKQTAFARDPTNVRNESD